MNQSDGQGDLKMSKKDKRITGQCLCTTTPCVASPSSVYNNYVHLGILLSPPPPCTMRWTALHSYPSPSHLLQRRREINECISPHIASLTGSASPPHPTPSIHLCLTHCPNPHSIMHHCTQLRWFRASSHQGQPIKIILSSGAAAHSSSTFVHMVCPRSLCAFSHLKLHLDLLITMMRWFSPPSLALLNTRETCGLDNSFWIPIALRTHPFPRKAQHAPHCISCLVVYGQMHMFCLAMSISPGLFPEVEWLINIDHWWCCSEMHGSFIHYLQP